MDRGFESGAVLLTAPNHTEDLLAEVEASNDETGRIRAFEAEFSFDRSEGSPRLFSVNRRRARRFSAQGDDCVRTGDIEVPVRDWSVRGVGLAEAWKGPEEAEVELRLRNRSFSARARTLGASGSTGLQLQVDGDPIPFVRELVKQSNPHWRFRDEVSEEEVTRLMSTSGYLRLREGNPLAPQWLRPEHPRVGLDMVWMDETRGRAVAHLSCTRAYRRTWVSHQLATLTHHPSRFDSHLACYRFASALPTLIDDDQAYKIAYLNRSKRLHRVLAEDFVRWMNDPEHALMTAWDRWEPSRSEQAPAPHEDPRVVPIDDVGRAWLVGHLRQSLPSLTRRALDLDGPEVTAEHLHPVYAELGLERGRHALMVRQRGRVVGAALIELSEPNLSIFNLFNLTQFFFEPEATPELRAALLRHVSGVYAKRGIHNPMLVSLPGALAGCEDGTYRLAETMGLMAWSADGLRQYENFIEYYFGRNRDQQPRKKKEAS